MLTACCTCAPPSTVGSTGLVCRLRCACVKEAVATLGTRAEPREPRGQRGSRRGPAGVGAHILTSDETCRTCVFNDYPETLSFNGPRLKRAYLKIKIDLACSKEVPASHGFSREGGILGGQAGPPSPSLYPGGPSSREQDTWMARLTGWRSSRPSSAVYMGLSPVAARPRWPITRSAWAAAPWETPQGDQSPSGCGGRNRPA